MVLGDTFLHPLTQNSNREIIRDPGQRSLLLLVCPADISEVGGSHVCLYYPTFFYTHNAGGIIMFMTANEFTDSVEGVFGYRINIKE